MLQGATGFWVAKIAQDWLLLQLTGDVSAVGTATALQYAPVLLFGLYGGVLADKFNVRGLLAGAQLLQGSGSAMLAILAITGNIAPWHIFVAASITGFASVVEQPARTSMITQLSGRFVGQAFSFNSLAFQMAGFWGPALSALVVAAVGPGYAFAANALGCTITAALLFRAPTKTPEPRGQDEPVTLRAGLSTIKETTEIGWTMVLSALVSLLALSMPLLYAGMANQVYKTGIPGYSTFNSVAAVGCVIGSLIAARQRDKSRLRMLVGLLLVGSICLMASSAAPNPVVFSAIIALQCVVITIFQLMANALVQLSVEPSARGRVSGLYLLIVFGGMSIAGPVVGVVVDEFGAPRTLQILGGLLLGCTIAAGLAIGRFSGQKLSFESNRLRISEPEVPRHVRLALKDVQVVLDRTEATLVRSEQHRVLASRRPQLHSATEIIDA